MTTTRQPEIDWLKGFAILCVIVNHAGALNGTWAYDYVITRAVPVFLVLFGMNAESWWLKRASEPPASRMREWFSSRFQRLVVPYWAAVSVWWTLVFLYGNATPPRTTGYFIASYVGYVPWVSTYWFVTLILECIIVYPAIRFVVTRFGHSLSAVAAMLITAGSALYFLEIIHWGQVALRNTAPNPHSYFWIFFPAYLWHIVAGATVARSPTLRSTRVAVLSGILYLAAALLRHRMSAGPHALAVMLLADVPLALVLLSAMRFFRAWAAPATLLAACGSASWGLYLGHILTHEAFHLFALRPDWSSAVNRWMYAGALLVSGIGLVTFGQALRQHHFVAWIPGLARRRARDTPIV